MNNLPNCPGIARFSSLRVTGTLDVGTLNAATTSLGNTTITGNLNVSNNIVAINNITGNVLYANLFNDIILSNNTKGSVTLTNCITLGNELTNPTQTLFPNITFTSNSQSGYTIDASSLGYYSYPAYQAFNGGTGWWSKDTAYNPDGGANANAAVLYYNYGQNASVGEWVSISCPNYAVLQNISFYNTSGFTFGFTMKSVSVFGQYGTSALVLIGSYTMSGAAPSEGTYNFNVSPQQAFNKFYFQCTQMGNQSGSGVTQACAVKSILFTGVLLNRTISQNIYLPQSLEVGRSGFSTLNTTRAFLVNGNSQFQGDVEVFGVANIGSIRVQGDIDCVGHVYRTVYACEAQGTGGTTVAGEPYHRYGTITVVRDVYNMIRTAAPFGVQAPRTGWYQFNFTMRAQDSSGLLSCNPQVVTSANVVIRSYQGFFLPEDSAFPRRSLTWCHCVYMSATNIYRLEANQAHTMFGWTVSMVYLGE